jgi:FtsZ-binding cell division protein ZapB
VENLIDLICECFSTAILIADEDPGQDPVDPYVKLKARHGIPKDQIQEQDRKSLFVDYLHTNQVPVVDRIPSLFVRQCFYFSFFGRPSDSPPGDPDATFELDQTVTLPSFYPTIGGLGQTDRLQSRVPPVLTSKREAELLREVSRLQSEVRGMGEDAERLRQEVQKRAAEQEQLLGESNRVFIEHEAEFERLRNHMGEALQKEIEKATQQEQLRKEASAKLVEQAAELERLRKAADKHAAEPGDTESEL